MEDQRSGTQPVEKQPAGGEALKRFLNRIMAMPCRTQQGIFELLSGHLIGNPEIYTYTWPGGPSEGTFSFKDPLARCRCIVLGCLS